ncbi:uncharacterized protein LOC121640354 isoform X3 [Scomber scombrus]|uniref:Uncharacterized protein LOC121640354 isoform X3 n=1 Tax=Scomber scombrus TaxID=13677 RepID=A0AAV1N326_SCOSC
MSAPTERKGETIKVVVLDRRKTEIDLCNTEEEMRSMTVLQLKEKLLERLPEYADTYGKPGMDLWLKDGFLEDFELLSECGIQHMSVIDIGSFLVFVRTQTGKVITIRVSNHMTVESLKARIQKVEGTPIDETESVICASLTSVCLVFYRQHPEVAKAERRTAAHYKQRKMVNTYQVKIFGLGGDMKMVNLCNTEEQMRSMTVKQLKDKIIERFPEYGVHSDNIRLIFTNKDLHVDSALLSEYGITHLSVIQMVMKIPGGGEWPEPGTGDGGMGDKDGRNASKERLANFETP